MAVFNSEQLQPPAPPLSFLDLINPHSIRQVEEPIIEFIQGGKREHLTYSQLINTFFICARNEKLTPHLYQIEQFMEQIGNPIKYEWPTLLPPSNSGEKDPTITFWNNKYIMATTQWSNGFLMGSATAPTPDGPWKRGPELQIDYANIPCGTGIGAPAIWADPADPNLIYLAFQSEYNQSGYLLLSKSYDFVHFTDTQVIVAAQPNSVIYDVSSTIIDGEFAGINYKKERVLIAQEYTQNPVPENPYANGQTNSHILRQLSNGHWQMLNPFLATRDVPTSWQKYDNDELKEWKGIEATTIDSIVLPNLQRVALVKHVNFLPHRHNNKRQRIALSVYDPSYKCLIPLGLMPDPARISAATGRNILEVGHDTFISDNQTGLLIPDVHGNIYHYFMARDTNDHNSWTIGKSTINYKAFQAYIASVFLR